MWDKMRHKINLFFILLVFHSKERNISIIGATVGSYWDLFRIDNTLIYLEIREQEGD